MTYHYDQLHVPLGDFWLATHHGRLVYVDNVQTGGPDDLRASLKLPDDAVLVRGGVPENVVAAMTALLTGGSRVLDPALYTVTGSDFQQRVYAALRQVPYGETRTYSELAAMAGMPTAVRAVAHAVGQNPLLVIQPCHRIVPKSGGIGNFSSGVDLKRALLDFEAGKRVH